jgi:hypothetical protein
MGRDLSVMDVQHLPYQQITRRRLAAVETRDRLGVYVNGVPIQSRVSDKVVLTRREGDSDSWWDASCH